MFEDLMLFPVSGEPILDPSLLDLPTLCTDKDGNWCGCCGCCRELENVCKNCPCDKNRGNIYKPMKKAKKRHIRR